MEYFLTNNQTKVPKTGLGTWLLKGKSCVDAVQYALHIGYRHIDTAQIYGNEAEVGQAIEESDVRRQDVFVVTKVWRDQLAPQNVIHSTEESLKKLRTDYVDLLLIHWPSKEYPVEESLKAMQTLLRDGKIRGMGLSNFAVEGIRKARAVASQLMCNQVEYHPFLSQKAVLRELDSQGMFLTAYSPLARNEVFSHPGLRKMARRYSRTVGQVVLRWLWEQKAVVSIPKASSPAHIKENFNITDFQLSEEDRLQIDQLSSQNRRLVNPPWSPEWD